MQKYISEIKNRILLLLVSYVSAVSVCYYYKDILLFVLLKPKYFFDNSSFFYFIFTDVTEVFYVYYRLIFFLSVQVLIIMQCYHFFLFISYALYKNEYKKIKLILLSMILVNFISFIVSYFFLIPFSWHFFLSFRDLFTHTSFTLYFEARLVEYFNFYVSLYYICGLYSQFSVLLFVFLNHINSNSYQNLKKFRKIFYFCLVIFSALICPEIISQILISFLLVFLYETFLAFCIFNSRFLRR
jgi:sec-independent protein translocase protein TatC